MSKKFIPRLATRRQGFSLIELVIVVVIIGIIAAIAIPKMSKGSAGAGDSALKGNLAVLRNAVELYTSEHGKLPDGASAAAIVDQLTKYTKVDGTGAASSKDVANGITYGPYIKKIPPLPVGVFSARIRLHRLSPAADCRHTTVDPTSPGRNFRRMQFEREVGPI